MDLEHAQTIYEYMSMYLELCVVIDLLLRSEYESRARMIVDYFPSFARALMRSSQQRAFDVLTSLARREVIFSDHQNNPVIMDFFRATGCTARTVAVPSRDKLGLERQRLATIWTAPGRAM